MLLFYDQDNLKFYAIVLLKVTFVKDVDIEVPDYCLPGDQTIGERGYLLQ